MEEHRTRSRCSWRSGPDCAGGRTLAPGRYVIGRAAQADLRCDDPALEPHHALLQVDDHGDVSVLQLTGRRPLPTAEGAIVEVGSSVLQCSPVEEPVAGAHIVDGAVHREPRVHRAWVEPELTEPDVPARHGIAHGALLPALLALSGAAAIAVVLRQVMFVVFGAMGAFVAVGAWAAQRIGGRRERRSANRRHVAEVEALQIALDGACAGFVAEHRHVAGSVAAAVSTIEALDGGLWSRRATDVDAFHVSAGTGELMWQPKGLDGTRARILGDEAVDVDLGPGRRLAVRGDWRHAGAVVRALVIQLAATCGPADVHLVVVTDDTARWRWLDGLPHARGSSGATLIGGDVALPAALDELHVDGPPGHVVVLTDQVELLATRTHPLRRFVMGERQPALIAVVPVDAAVPHVCTSQLHVSATGGVPVGRWLAHSTGGLPQTVRIAGLGERTAARLVARLRPLRDPDDPLTAAASVPADVDLAALLTAGDPGALTAEAIAANWLAGGNDPPPRTVLGRAADGVVDVDLARDGPHALLAGTTGAGKSELLRSLVVGLACGSSPDHLDFVLVDYKGGATFDGCAALPHVVGVVTDLDERLADRALRSLQAELRVREERLRHWSVPDLTALRERAAHEVLPRLVVIIDEFAALVAEQPAFIEALVGVAQRGRSLGVHLILATQRPQGVITEQIRANTNLRIALRLQDSADSVDVVGSAAAAQIARRRPGRAVVRLGPDELVEFQTAQLTGDEVVASVADAWRLVGGRAPRRPWQEPLPTALEPRADGLGLVDDPDRQTIEVLSWTPADGNLLIVGSGGTGVSTALLAAGVAALDDPGVHVYGVDASGGSALHELTRSARCAGVVAAHEGERLGRLLDRLSALSEAVAADGAGLPHPVLLIDGFGALRAQLDDLDTADQHAALARLVGGARGITVVFTADRPSAVPPAILAQCASRWVLHLRDAHDAALLGVPPSAVVPSGIAGRMVVMPGGREAQLALPRPVVDVGGPPAAPIEAMPAVLSAAELPRSSAEDGTTALVLGLRFVDGMPAVMRLHDGEHALVIGPPRSGRTLALARLAGAWADAHPEGLSVAVRSRRSPPIAARLVVDGAAELLAGVEVHGGGRPLLVLIDDAELVDDAGGRLATLAATNQPGLTVVAAGRPDALRQSYGHWTTVVRRSRLGLVMAASNDLDGDLLGVALPRRLPVPARPGLAWLVGDEAPLLVQVAVADDGPLFAGGRGRRRPIVTGAWPGPSPSAAHSSAPFSATNPAERWSSG